MGKCAIDKMTGDMAMELATENIDIVSWWAGAWGLQTRQTSRASNKIQATISSSKLQAQTYGCKFDKVSVHSPAYRRSHAD